MKLKNKYSKQNIYSNQKFEDQIWYNQQIMTFLKFTTFEKCFLPKFSRKTLFWKPNQIFLWLESVFRWPTFLMANKHMKVWKMIFRKPLSRKQTQPKRKTLSWKLSQIFLWLKSVFRWPESIFRWLTFLMANKHKKVWEVVFWKLLSRKQTWSKIRSLCLRNIRSKQGFF